ncbi:hypothetical protein RD100_002122 [Salmonella enterica]|nr:hypothetical protein [Salmonella enterica]EGI5078155.1 hypothetical protein [Salmonella enterica subsp. enterica serovar Infantis]EGH3148036.1 hypothetical protein [Salmonella enterica]EGI7726005.1 hypothetical protein [Salmonella enterica]EGI7752755.1 hypothetical protein [Salmonella enterica]
MIRELLLRLITYRTVVGDIQHPLVGILFSKTSQGGGFSRTGKRATTRRLPCQAITSACSGVSE